MSDFYHDQGALFVKLLHDQELPEFVKSAEFDSNYDVSGLPDASFADPRRRLFPCQSPADAFVSAAYYHARPGLADPAVEASLNKFARLHGIESEMEQVIERAKNWRNGSTAKTAAPAPTPWAVDSSIGTWRGEDGESLQKAAASFVRQYAVFEWDELGRVAEGFLKAAEPLGAALPPDVARFAGRTPPDAALAREALQKRALLLREPGERQSVANAVLNVDEATFDCDAALKLAAWLCEFDGERGLNFRWGRELTDPMRSVFGEGTPKEASDERTVALGGRAMKIAEFDEDLGKLALGEEFTRERLVSLSAEDSSRLLQYL
jgi:hypothetical protein